MSEVVLSLGPIVFRSFEVPSSITFGGRQRAVVRYLGSGRRVTDALGPDDATISFGGFLSGPDATARAQELDSLRSLGLPLILTWDSLIYSVLISDFRAEYRNRLWIPYRLSCLVISNPINDILQAGLSMAGDAIASLNLMYDSAPQPAVPIPDIRPTISSGAIGARLGAMQAMIAMLDTLTPSIQAEQERQAATISRVALRSSTSVPRALEDFHVAVAAAGALQSLTLSQHCLGQAQLYLTGRVQ